MIENQLATDTRELQIARLRLLAEPADYRYAVVEFLLPVLVQQQLVVAITVALLAMLGAGIYGLIGKAAGQVGNAVWLAFIVALIAALLTALSYASLGAAAIWNVLGDHDALVLAEGLDVFRAPMPPELAGTALRDAGIREATRCHVVAIARDGDMDVAPEPATVLPADADLVLIGDAAAEREFLDGYRRRA